MKICCFAGHSSIFGKEDLPAKLKKEIINLIENHNVTTFYNGGKGDFDWLCAHTIDDLLLVIWLIDKILCISTFLCYNSDDKGITIQLISKRTLTI